MFYRAPAAVQINIRLLFVLVWSLSFAATRAADEPKPVRIALVIGNNRYEPSVGPLRNTVNDAKAMAKTLRSLGFTVIEKHNVTRDQLLTAMLQFRTNLSGAEVGLFYFAGHGISVAGANYLLPIKSGYKPEGINESGLRLLAETKLFNAEQAVAEMNNAGVSCNLVILDACRTTPIARNPMARDATKAGLVEMNPPAGSLIAFATDAGRAASDGEGINGLYTRELIAQLRTPGLTIEQVFKRTRRAVMERSGGTQIPAEYSRLVGDDIFLAGPAPDKPPEDVIPKGEPIPVPTIAEINQFAVSGDVPRCIEAMRRHTRSRGPAAQITAPLAILLNQVKEILSDPKTASERAEPSLQNCDLILSVINDCVPATDSQRTSLTAKTHNRRGDALLLLGRNEDALESFNQAIALTPNDAYVRYNRGRALLALDRKDEAKADFTAASDRKLKQPGARKLASEALQAMKNAPLTVPE